MDSFSAERDLIGQVVSHYLIEEELGVGGMSVVYRAIDQRLGRQAALKFLPGNLSEDPDARQRLTQEAQAASGLDHPNICTIYQIDETPDGALFIAMAFYEGETLDHRIRQGPLPWEEATMLAAQVASGLAAAHDQGIVHRDIKPANLLITGDNLVKILDFGIARLSGAGMDGDRMVYGTVPYMSPEQLRGKPIDRRTDIWSLGIVLQQMLTGRRPFNGSDREEVRKAILRRAPEPLTSTVRARAPQLAQILSGCLTKSRDERYQDARKLKTDLEAVAKRWSRGSGTGGTGPATGEITEVESPFLELSGPASPSIAVLPFEDLSPESNQAYLATGIAEALIGQLAQIQGLRVLGRTSISHPSYAHLEGEEIGRRLDVETLLMGSVQVYGRNLRVLARLMSVSDGSVLWTGKFDREQEDLFEIQDEIAEQIVDALELELMGRSRERVGFSHEVHRLYMKGRHCWNERTADSLKEAVVHFKRTLDLEPRFARAHAGLADAYALLGIYGASPPAEVMAPAKAAAQAALELDDSLADAYNSRACVRSAFDWDFNGSAQDFEKAIELDAQHPTAHQWYAMNCLIPKLQFKKAEVQLARAAELDPMSLAIKTSQGLYYYYCGQFETAIKRYQAVLDLEGVFPQTLIFMAYALLQVSKPKEAIDAALQAAQLTGGRPTATTVLSIGHASLGDLDQARWLLEKLMESKGHYVPPTLLAQIYTALNEKELALGVLGRAQRFRTSDLIWLGVDPIYRKLHSFVDFQNLLRSMGLERHRIS